MTEHAVTAVVVDDHPITRLGVVTMLQQHGIVVVGEAGTGEDGVAAVAQHRPDVLVTDLRLGAGIDGVGVTEQVRALPSPPAVLVLTTYDEDRDIVRAVEAGAAGYLLKDAPPDQLGRAVRDAARGLTVLTPDLARRVVTHLQEARVSLSARESEILALVADGRSNRDIARALVISEATVKTHLVHIFTKLDASSRTEAVAIARRRGLLG